MGMGGGRAFYLEVLFESLGHKRWSIGHEGMMHVAWQSTSWRSGGVFRDLRLFTIEPHLVCA